MARPPDDRTRIDRDGVRTSRRASESGPNANASRRFRVILLGGVVLSIAGLAWLSRSVPDEEVAASTPTPAVEAPPPAEWASVKEVKPKRLASRERKADRETEEPLPEIDAADVIAALVEAGETGGIAAFPPPGTDPVKRGIVVPEDYELPEGYVRHYQATDDGKGLEPILMFSPDYEFQDQDGRAIPLPSDRIVPPELAPPGLPIRTLDVPEPGGKTSR